MSGTTLRARIGDAPEPPMPAERDGIHWRPATEGDIDAILGYFVAAAAADHPDWAETREEIVEEFGHSWVDLTRDTLLALEGDVVVAYGHVVRPPDADTLERAILFGGVRPSHRGRGLGRELLAWQRARALQMLAECERDVPGWILAYAEERAPASSRLLQRAGMPLVRWFSKLERDLHAPLEPRTAPEGIRIAAPRPEDEEAARLARNDAFRDHWASQPSNPELWHGSWTMETFEPALSRLAWDGDRVVGFVLVWFTPGDVELQGWLGGYVGLVGTVREARGRGIAPALLTASLDAARAAGHERIALDVDSENPTGALGLYTRLGFEPVSRSVAHVDAR